MTFTSSYAHIAFGYGNKLIAHIWSLCVEEHTYLLLLAITLVARRFPGRDFMLVGFALLSLGDGAFRMLVLGQNAYQAYFITDTKLCSILVPLLFYIHRTRLIGLFGKISGPVALGAGMLGVLLFYGHVPDLVREVMAPFFFGLSVALIDESAPPIHRLLETRWLVQVGIWSYSLYLWQEPFYLIGLDHDVSYLIRLACILPMFGAAIASFYLIEQPVRRRLNALLHEPAVGRGAHRALAAATGTGI